MIHIAPAEQGQDKWALPESEHQKKTAGRRREDLYGKAVELKPGERINQQKQLAWLPVLNDQ
jgi:hypothetical protein